MSCQVYIFFVRRYVDIHVGDDICTCQENACRWLSFLPSQVVICGAEAKRLWISRGRGARQKWRTCWWEKPLGCMGGIVSMDETWWNCWHLWEWKNERGLDSESLYQRCLPVRFWRHDSWNQNPLPNHYHKPPTNNWAPTSHEFDWISRLDSGPNMEYHGILLVETPCQSMPPIQFLSPSRTNQIIRLCTDRTGIYFLCLTIFSNTWRPKGHRWARAGEGICSLDFGGWIILCPRCCLHLRSAQGMKRKAWHRE